MRQIQFIEFNDEISVNIISSDNQHHLHVEHNLPNGEYVVDSASGNYPNALMLSEALRDAIGFGPARDILRKHGVAEDDPLMTLGRKG